MRTNQVSAIRGQIGVVLELGGISDLFVVACVFFVGSTALHTAALRGYASIVGMLKSGHTLRDKHTCTALLLSCLLACL